MQELSLNILDIAQNSVRAGATLIQIRVEQDTRRDFMSIEIEDNGCGMTPEQVAHVVDPFYTTRTTRKVGLGVPFFKMAAQMANGEFSIRSAPGEGTLVRGTFVNSHIDRMPLGDMAETVSCLSGCNPDLDFVYTYTYNGGSFTADTREFRQILQGIPLSSPQVITFLKEMIRQNTQELLTGAPG